MNTKMMLVSFLLGGCVEPGDDTGSWSDEPADVEGIYELSTWEIAECGADAGTALAFSDGAVVDVYRGSAFGMDYLQVNVCETMTECATVRSGGGAVVLESWTLTEGPTADGWSGEMATARSTEDGCTGFMEDILLTQADDGLRLVADRTEQVTFEPDSDGICWTDDAADAAAEADCESRQVLCAALTD